jgi:hypothetical protein
MLLSGLPVGIFSCPKFEYVLEGLGTENVGIYNGQVEYFTVIWNIS